ncbi:unnamed protein product [Cyberlindnera jadinii]|uniref:Uncharacterized protein n=1 Tax=Cyberlindnera jadinii (strain ATCC 18201 / CBS 1600 / BCRC 20928 / JCM 3617 / NBRC 0987 / NRRL Y-1542) TaxID=983966 RepID=A0A0H5C7T4_CYBJN|nr:unnamed protein product [Cyberlindnera jadinii]
MSHASSQIRPLWHHSCKLTERVVSTLKPAHQHVATILRTMTIIFRGARARTSAPGHQHHNSAIPSHGSQTLNARTISCNPSPAYSKWQAHDTQLQ